MRRRLASSSLLASTVLAGCGDDLVRSPYTVDTRGPGGGAMAVAYDDGDRWRAAAQVEAGVFRFVPAEPTVGIAIVCGDGDRPIVRVEHAMASGKRDLARPCAADADPAAGVVRVAPVGAHLAVGGVTHPGTGELEPAERTITGTGPVDVVAFTDAQMVIRRRVVLPLAGPLAIDVASEGAALERLSATVGVDGDETAGLAYTLITSNGTHATLRGGGVGGSLSVATAPRSLLAAGDRHRLEVSAWRDGTYRSAAVSAPAADPIAAPPTLPAPMTAASARWDDGVLAIDWQGRLAGEVELRIGQGALTYLVSASPEWLAETGDERAGTWRSPAVAEADGWQPAWRFDRGAPALWAVSGSEERADGEVELLLESGRSGVLAAATR
jgi:hypothetical protein